MNTWECDNAFSMIVGRALEDYDDDFAKEMNC